MKKSQNTQLEDIPWRSSYPKTKNWFTKVVAWNLEKFLKNKHTVINSLKLEKMDKQNIHLTSPSCSLNMEDGVWHPSIFTV